MITTLFKKQFLKIMLCAIALGALHPVYAISDKALGLGFASAGIGFAVMNEELAESETFEKLAKFINVDKDDLAPCLVFSTALWAASYIPQGAGRTVLRAGALLPILAAACLPKKALNKLALLPGIRHYFSLMKDAKGLPLIGDYAQCNQLNCKGLCHKCKARKLFLTVPLAAIPFVPTVFRSFKDTIARWERERIADVHRPHYEALNIPLDTELTDEMVREKYAQAMRATHTDKGNKASGAAEKIVRINTARDTLRAFLKKMRNPLSNPRKSSHNLMQIKRQITHSPKLNSLSKKLYQQMCLLVLTASIKNQNPRHPRGFFFCIPYTHAILIQNLEGIAQCLLMN